MKTNIFYIGLISLLFSIAFLGSCASSPVSSENQTTTMAATTLTSPNNLFLYIPDEEIMTDYLHLHSYLMAWDNDEVAISDENLSAFFNYYVGKDTLQGLLFESFLRYTKNKNVQNRVLEYIYENEIETNFTNSLKILYAAVPVINQSGERTEIQYNYNNSLFDENINLFSFNEVLLFNGELGMLLFDNDWSVFSVPSSGNMEMFGLMYGGGTNYMTIIFTKHSNLNERNIETVFRQEYYSNMFGNNWVIDEISPVGIMSRSGADKIYIAHGLGTERLVRTIENGAFNVYLYNRSNRTLYEINYFMNFSHVNIHYSERQRIFNLLFFQLLFAFLQ